MTARLDLPVSEIMATRIEMVSDTIPLNFAAKLMFDKRVSGLPVTTEEGMLVGVLSWMDVMKAFGEHMGRSVSLHGGDFYQGGVSAVVVGEMSPFDALPGTVRDFMSDRVVAVGADATVADAARLIAKSGVHRVLVVDENDNLAGLVSAIDIVRYVSEGSDG